MPDKKGKRAMKKRGRYFLYLLPTTIVIGTIVLSVLFATGTLHPTQRDRKSVV